MSLVSALLNNTQRWWWLGTLLAAIFDRGLQMTWWCIEEVEGCFNPDWEQDVMGIEFGCGLGVDFGSFSGPSLPQIQEISCVLFFAARII